MVRDNSNISGLRLSDTLSPKIAAFADNLLFFVTNPLVSIPNLMTELKKYEALSFFKVNYQKSEALNVSMPASLDTLLRADFPFKWAGAYIKYLGILLPGRMEDIFPLNFPPLLTDIKKRSSELAEGHVLLIWTMQHNKNECYAQATISLAAPPN